MGHKRVGVGHKSVGYYVGMRNSGELGMLAVNKTTHPINTLSAPRGVTRMGGANVYAAKLATIPTISVPINHVWEPRRTFADDH